DGEALKKLARREGNGLSIGLLLPLSTHAPDGRIVPTLCVRYEPVHGLAVEDRREQMLFLPEYAAPPIPALGPAMPAPIQPPAPALPPGPQPVNVGYIVVERWPFWDPLRVPNSLSYFPVQNAERQAGSRGP